MILVDYNDIKVPENRFRKAFPPEADAELAASIKSIGLLHPPTVERNGDIWTLRAGERRLRILQKLLGEGHILRCGMQEFTGKLVPCLELSSLTPLQRLEIEVEENVLRTDFSFLERAAALAALHDLRSRQNPQQSLTSTSVEATGKSQPTDISNAIILTRHANDPDVAKAKNAKEALAVIRKKAEAIHQHNLARSVDVSKIKHRLILGDALAVLPTLPEKSFDVILVDPQYGVGADNFGDQFATGHDYEDSYSSWKELFRAIPDQFTRVAKERAHCYIFCDQRRFAELTALMVLANWKVFPSILIWYKGSGALPLPQHGPRRTYECILYAYRGERQTLVVKNDCIVNVPPVRNLRVGAQKPVALYCDLLRRSANPGDTVLDCFGGSGPILVAANILKCIATYIERDEAAYNIALSRASVSEIDDGAPADDGLRINLANA
jgi:site-specific DNA-methyltransferase (adenine-specific)